jgi:RNA polymerase sigma-70 factor (ECF subfamily)
LTVNLLQIGRPTSNQSAAPGIKRTRKQEISHLAALLTAYSSDYSRRMTTSDHDIVAREAAWIRQAKRSDAKAFEALYRLHVDKIYGLCLRMTGNVSEAEDCTQEAFIQAWKKLRLFRGDSAFATWLHRIAVNSVLGRMRKSKRDQERLLAVADTSAPPRATNDGGDLQDLADAINSLPERARHVFVLHAVYGYSHDEAGDMLGIASGTSKAQLHRARKLLAQQLEDEGFSE